MTNPMLPGLSEIDERVSRARHLLVGLDYDGTLTPIVDEPAAARLAPAMRQALGALVQRRDVTVAVISGRAHADLQNLVALPGVVYASNHGMEIHGPGITYLEPVAKEASERLCVLANRIADQVRDIRGAFVENKGLTLSVHYRQVAPVDTERVGRIVRAAVEPVRSAFQITLGDKVHEVRPITHWNKGAAINWINRQIGAPDALVIYIGDDATDEDAFRVLADNAVTIRVGDRAETAAQFLLPDPATVLRFLEWIRAIRAQKG